MKELQEWAGHSSYSTTANIYSHIQAKSKTRLTESLENMLSQRSVRQLLDKQIFRGVLSLLNAKEKRPKLQRLRRFLSLVGEDGFEPSKQNPTDLQSAPFGHSGILPYVKPTA